MHILPVIDGLFAQSTITVLHIILAMFQHADMLSISVGLKLR